MKIIVIIYKIFINGIKIMKKYVLHIKKNLNNIYYIIKNKIFKKYKKFHEINNFIIKILKNIFLLRLLKLYEEKNIKYI